MNLASNMEPERVNIDVGCYIEATLLSQTKEKCVWQFSIFDEDVLIIHVPSYETEWVHVKTAVHRFLEDTREIDADWTKINWYEYWYGK